MKKLSKKQRNALYKKALNHFKTGNISTSEYLCFLFRDMIFGDAWVKGKHYAQELSQKILDEFKCFTKYESNIFSWNFDDNEDRVFVLAMCIEMSK